MSHGSITSSRCRRSSALRGDLMMHRNLSVTGGPAVAVDDGRQPVDDMGANVGWTEHDGVLQHAEHPGPERIEVGRRHEELD